MVDNFFDKSIDEVMKLLKTSKNGLSTSQADQRLHKYGLNELEVGEGPSPWKILLSQFKSPLVWILIVALVISWFLGEAVDVIVIGIIIVVNAVLGFSQEYRAEKAIDALRKMASPQSKVIRNGKDKKIDSKYLVPGDVIILETGDKIPADSRLFEV